MGEQEPPSGACKFHRLDDNDVDEEPPSGACKFHRLGDHGVDDELLSSLKRSFDDDGFVCLASVFDKATITRLREAADVNFEECFQRLFDGGHTSFPRYCRNGGDGSEKVYALDHGVKGGFKEIVMRSPGRFEMPFGCDRHPFSDDAIIKNDLLLRVVKTLFSGEDYYMSNMSIVTSTPRSSDQGWHADGGHINLQSHDECHCFNVFVPLIDVTVQLGPTELRPGSHYLTRNLTPMMLAAKARGKLRKPVMPLLGAGDALVFDYRVLHRGRANIGDIDRPILVMTFAKQFFNDKLNFPRRSIDDNGGL